MKYRQIIFNASGVVVSVEAVIPGIGFPDVSRYFTESSFKQHDGIEMCRHYTIGLAILFGILGVSGVSAQTMINTELVRNISDYPSHGMITNGDTLFYTEYEWLISADISDPLNPVFLDTIAWSLNDDDGYICGGLSLAFPHLYGTTQKGIIVFDVSNPSAMKRDTVIEVLSFGSLTMSYKWKDLLLARNYYKMYVFDASEPSKPRLIDELDYGIPEPIRFGPRILFFDSLAYTGKVLLKYIGVNGLSQEKTYKLDAVTGLTRGEKYIYVGRIDEIEVQEIDNAFEFPTINTIVNPLGDSQVTDIQIAQTYLYALNDAVGYVYIYDLSDPVEPQKVATFGNSRWGPFIQMVIRGEYLYISSIANGVMLVKTTLPAVATETVSDPSTYSLSPAYPNPCSGSTTLTYSLPRQQHITLEVYNTLGRKVRTLYSGIREPGEYTAQFNAAGLPAGMYRMVLRSGEGVKTRTVVVR